jgi:hypothetical protein
MVELPALTPKAKSPPVIPSKRNFFIESPLNVKLAVSFHVGVNQDLAVFIQNFFSIFLRIT